MKASELEEIVDNLWKVSGKLDDEGHDEYAKQVMACASKLSYLILKEVENCRYSLAYGLTEEDVRRLIKEYIGHEAD